MKVVIGIDTESEGSLPSNIERLSIASIIYYQLC